MKEAEWPLPHLVIKHPQTPTDEHHSYDQEKITGKMTAQFLIIATVKSLGSMPPLPIPSFTGFQSRKQ